MNELDKKRIESKRLSRAKDIAWQIKQGHYPPASFDEMESFFPQRKIIKKDNKEIERTYNKDSK